MIHPCFNAQASRRWGRIHLPIAPACNIVCAYCDRSGDCPNESRPGLASRLMSPVEALEHLEKLLSRLDHISVVGLAGPGDPLAAPDLTLETLRLLRIKHPELIVCLSTNGLALAENWPDLYDLGVRHLTLTINAIDPVIGGRIYHAVGQGDRSLRGEEGAALLLARQETALRLMMRKDVNIKINTVLIPGINEGQVERIAKFAATHGAALMNCLALIPVKGTSLGDREPPDDRLMEKVRASAEKHLPQMRHCGRCRADAAGLLAGPPPFQISPMAASAV